jgi:hypothetical protein
MIKIDDNDPKVKKAERDYNFNYVEGCICPNCGQREPSKMGVPCYNRRCSKCGAAMTGI